MIKEVGFFLPPKSIIHPETLGEGADNWKFYPFEIVTFLLNSLPRNFQVLKWRMLEHIRSDPKVEMGGIIAINQKDRVKVLRLCKGSAESIPLPLISPGYVLPPQDRDLNIIAAFHSHPLGPLRFSYHDEDWLLRSVANMCSYYQELIWRKEIPNDLFIYDFIFNLKGSFRWSGVSIRINSIPE